MGRRCSPLQRASVKPNKRSTVHLHPRIKRVKHQRKEKEKRKDGRMDGWGHAALRRRAFFFLFVLILFRVVTLMIDFICSRSCWAGPHLFFCLYICMAILRRRICHHLLSRSNSHFSEGGFLPTPHHFLHSRPCNPSHIIMVYPILHALHTNNPTPHMAYRFSLTHRASTVYDTSKAPAK